MRTGSHLTARPLSPDDIAFAVRAVNAAQPHHPWTEDELRIQWSSASKMGEISLLVLEDQGRPAGWVAATLWHEAVGREGRVAVYLVGTGPEQLDQAWAIVEDAAR
jgi:hypothetical protein